MHVALLAVPVMALMACHPVQAAERAGAVSKRAPWPAETPGGTGGAIVRVTTLDADGPGSLRSALARAGPRIVVFDVGGIIDLDKQSLEITSPKVTIAGQTAPPPGITLIRGGLAVQTHDVRIQHLRIRPGSAGERRGGNWAPDALSTGGGAHRVVIENCSLTWAVDEVAAASGPRFEGTNATEWRRATSHDIVFRSNIIAEALSRSTHPKFEHSKGLLVHDNVTRLLVHGNLLAHNRERNPLLKGGVHAVMVNNFIYDPGSRAVHYNLLPAEWSDRPHEPGRLTAVGNVLRAGPSTDAGLPFLMLGGAGDLMLHARDNLAVDRHGNPLPALGRYTTSPARIIEHDAPLSWPDGLHALPANEVESWVLAHAGARPWDRDAHDQRIISNVAEGRGRIIDSEEDVGGYPQATRTRRAFVASEWNLDTMTPRAPGTLDADATHY
jgi:hypothetical protein